MVSFRSDMARGPPLDVGPNDEIVDHRREQVGEQDGQHHAFRKGRVDDADHHHHHADQRAVDPLAGIGHRGRHRIGGHVHHAEGIAADHEMPVPGHGEHRIGVRTDPVEQRGKADHADHHAGDDAPGGDPHQHQNPAAGQDDQRAGLADRTRHQAEEGVPPAQPVGHHRVDAPRGGGGEGGGARVAVHRHPHLIPRHEGGVGEEQEGARHQGRIHEVLAGAAEDLLAQHHAEADPQRRLPQRQIGRQDQREQHRGDEKAFVDLVPADRGEQHFPGDADDEDRRIERQEIEPALNQVVPRARRIDPGQQAQNRETPAVLRRQQVGVGGERQIGLIADVPHAERHDRKCGQPHRGHHPLQVHGVAHVRRGAGDRIGAVEQRVDGFVQRLEAMERATRLAMAADLVQNVSQPHASALSLDASQHVPQHRTVFVFARAHIGAQGQVLFVEFQTTQLLRGLGVAHQQRAQQLRGQDVQRHHRLVVAYRHHGARAAVGGGGEGQQPASQPGGQEGPGDRVLVRAGAQIVHELAVAAFGQTAHLNVIAPQPVRRAARGAPAEDRAGDDALLARLQFAVGQIGQGGAQAGAQKPGIPDGGTGQRDDALDPRATGDEQLADGDDVLIADVPDRLFRADRIEEMDVRPRQTGGVRPLEDFRVDALDPLARQRGPRGPAQEHLRQPRQHHQPLREGLGLPGDHHGGVRRQGMGVQRGDEDRGRPGADRGHLAVGAGAQGGPQTRLLKVLAHLGVAQGRQIPGVVTGEIDGVVALDRDHDGLEPALLAPVDVADQARRGRGEVNAGIVLVGEQGLAQPDPFALLHQHRGLQVGIVEPHQRDAADGVSIVDFLYGIAFDRQVQTAFDLHHKAHVSIES